MTIVDAVLNAASLFTFVREEPKGSNAGQAVEAFLRHTKTPKGQPWCASFVCTILDGMLGQRNPVPTTASCQAIADWGKTSGRIAKAPSQGAIFLLWFPSLGRYAHTGFVVRKIDDRHWETIEGNTGDVGEREGYGVFRKTRTFGVMDRFIPWYEGL